MVSMLFNRTIPNRFPYDFCGISILIVSLPTISLNRFAPIIGSLVVGFKLVMAARPVDSLVVVDEFASRLVSYRLRRLTDTSFKEFASSSLSSSDSHSFAGRLRFFFFLFFFFFLLANVLLGGDWLAASSSRLPDSFFGWPAKLPAKLPVKLPVKLARPFSGCAWFTGRLFTEDRDDSEEDGNTS